MNALVTAVNNNAISKPRTSPSGKNQDRGGSGNTVLHDFVNIKFCNKKPYPTSCCTKKVKRIGSTRLFGDRSEAVNPESIDYLFPGEKDTALGNECGSSAATALASGLAALILWCAEAYRMPEDYKMPEKVKILEKDKPDKVKAKPKQNQPPKGLQLSDE